MKYVELTLVDVGLAAGLIIVNSVISIVLGLKLGRSLLLASIRTILQLLLIGMILDSVFAIDRWYAVAGLLLVMTITAGVAAVGRTERRYPGVYFDSIVAIWASSWIVAAYAMLAIMREVEPWYQPQYAIPLVGMILGNALNGISLGLNRLGEQLTTHRDQVEALLTMGATRGEAARDSIRQAVQTGMVPIINSMMVVGIVSLPGMMTGQLLSGVSPMQAVRYQIVIMFVIAAATALGTVGVVLLGYRRLFNEQHQFRSDLLSRS
ncbi:MAG: iron export ABC transporter permease subunit FetB [Planctomycetota bacterium]|nr:iron export ABC transporter permease subunit FetB [Planctomycetota bacterium]